MKKSILSLIMALSLCFSLIVSASAANTSFTDVPSNHWAYSFIENCAGKGIVSGVGDGTFQPDGKVTYAQFSVMLSKAFFADEVAACAAQNPGKPWYWVPMYVLTENELDPIAGQRNSGPSDWDKAANVSMNRYQMAYVMFNLLPWTPYDDNDYYGVAERKLNDWSKIPEGYRYAVATSVFYGVINGTDGGNFAGDGLMTRAQACVVITKLLEVCGGSGSSNSGNTITGSDASTQGNPGNATTGSNGTENSSSSSSNVSYTGLPKDVPGGHQYAEAINALAQGGVLSDVIDANGNFRPDDVLTHGQMALLYVKIYNNVNVMTAAEASGKTYNDVLVTELLKDPEKAAAVSLVLNYNTGYTGTATGRGENMNTGVSMLTTRAGVSVMASRANMAAKNVWTEAELRPYVYNSYTRWLGETLANRNLDTYVTNMSNELNCGAFTRGMDLDRLTDNQATTQVTRGEFCQYLYNLGITSAGQLRAPLKTNGLRT